MPKVNKKILIFTAGIMWSAVGLMLFSKASLLYGKVPHELFPILSAIGVIIGLIKMYFIFRKIVLKNVKRIKSYENKKVCFFAFQKWQSYALIAFMVTLGIFMSKSSFVPREVLLVVDSMVGTALLSASYFYYRALF